MSQELNAYCLFCIKTKESTIVVIGNSSSSLQIRRIEVGCGEMD
jgi:hypothetical protein